MTTATRRDDLQQPGRAQPTAKSRTASIVALSMAAGLIAAAVLVAMPFIPARENVLTGVVLLAFALGWALLALLSVRFGCACGVGPEGTSIQRARTGRGAIPS